MTFANATNLYIIDYFLVVPLSGDASGVETTRAAPSSTIPIVTTNAVPVGAIVGGVVGGIAGIVLLAFLAYYFLLRRRNGGPRYFDRPTAADILAAEGVCSLDIYLPGVFKVLLDNVEPFTVAPTTRQSPASTAALSTRPQSAYTETSSTQPLNPSFRQTVVSSLPSQYTQSGPSETGLTNVSGSSARQSTGKGAHIARQYEAVVQHHDSGARMGLTGEQEPGPSDLPTDVPPQYTPN